MRLARAVAAPAVAVAVFVATVAVTFPTDEVVRAIIARHTPPGWPRLTFGAATLRPRGALLEPAELRRPDGKALARVDWALLRPSLRGLLRDRSGLPWTVTLGACAGTVTATVDGDGPGHVVRVAFHDVDLARCPPLAITGEAIGGIASGTAEVRAAPASQPTAEGRLDVRGATWSAGGRLPGVEALHADPAAVRWRLDDGRLVLEQLDLHGPELAASGAGTLELADPFGDTGVDVLLAVTPGPAASPLVHTLLDLLPPAASPPGARTLAVAGTLDAPVLVR